MSVKESETVYPFPRDVGCPFAPSPQLAELRHGSRLSRVRLWDGSHAWLVTGYEDVREILVDTRLSSDVAKQGFPRHGAGVGATQTAFRTFLNMDDPEHSRHRRMLTADFMIRRVEALRPRIQEHADLAVSRMASLNQPADTVTSVAMPVTSAMIAELLGVPYEDFDLFHRHSGVLGSGEAGVEESLTAFEEMREYFRTLVDYKRRNPGVDITSHLTKLQDAGQITADETLNMLRLMVDAGYKTTASMVALGALALMQHPDQLAWLMSDPSARSAGAVEELLRFLTISHFGRRRVATEDFEFAGQMIRTGEGVIAANDSANWDESVFPHPNVLDLTRDARHHLAFGFGPHQCLGQSLARVELQVVYPTLFGRFPDLQVAAPAEALRFNETMVFYGVTELPVSW